MQQQTYQVKHKPLTSNGLKSKTKNTTNEVRLAIRAR